MPSTQAEFDAAVRQLRCYVSALAGLIDDTFPEGYAWPPEDPRVTGTASEEPMRPIAKSIDGVLGSYDALQTAMGEKHPRHEPYLHGRHDG
jgi:hypothetical protein